MNARTLLKCIGYEIDEDFVVHDIQMDSRLIQENDIFIALRGTHLDGHHYIASALENGAKLVMAEYEVPGFKTIIMQDSHQTLSDLAYYFYGEPTKEMEVIGVTGTNGKTTTTTLIYHALQKMNKACALIGTNGLYYKDHLIGLDNTTPVALLLMRYFKMLKDLGIHTVIMEVSSHALALGRVSHVNFKIAVFTNLTQDHLDFHQDMESYLNAKKILFENLNQDAYAILNHDDKTFEVLKNSTKAHVVSYGVDGGDYQATHISLDMKKTQFDVNGFCVTSDLLSMANVYNLLAVYGVMVCLGYSKQTVIDLIKTLPCIKGRMEKVYNQEFLALVDYAHSPDAIFNALTFLNQIKKGQLIVVMGCGGDRDKSKRPKMAQVSCHQADFVIMTSDNPRTENPLDILKDMIEGLNYLNYCVIVNRKEAIQTAISVAQPGDIVAVLGKGHEDYQIIGTKKYHLSDKEEILKAIKGE